MPILVSLQLALYALLWALSASFGVSGWLASDQHCEDVLRRADNAMYQAKRQGRNCVVLQAQ